MFCFHARDSIDKSPEQQILRLNNMLAEYISAITLLKKENMQLKKSNSNLEQEIAHLREQLDPISIKEKPISGNGVKQLVYIRYV